MIRRVSLLLPLALVCGAAAPPPAPARVASGPAQHNSNAPVDVDAAHMEVHDKEHRAFLTGNVKAVQQDMTLTADRITASYTGSFAGGDGGQAGAAGGTGAKGGGPQLHRLDASGHVVVTRPTEVSHGDFGIYDLDKRLVTLIGNVTLDRTGPNAGTARGGRLVINLNTGQATMDGSSVGGKGSTGAGGRVSGRFTVPQHTDSQTTPAPANPSGK